jgi:hypothetical protein
MTCRGVCLKPVCVPKQRCEGCKKQVHIGTTGSLNVCTYWPAVHMPTADTHELLR